MASLKVEFLNAAGRPPGDGVDVQIYDQHSNTLLLRRTGIKASSINASGRKEAKERQLWQTELIYDRRNDPALRKH